MIGEYTKLYDDFLFLKKKPPAFQEAFCTVFGTEIENEDEIILLTKSFTDLMWYKVRNGRVISNKDVYRLRGRDISLSSTKNNHHFPPRSRNGGALTIKISEEFHRAWHILFMNLYKKEELFMFWEILFSCQGINSTRILWQIIDQIRAITEKKERESSQTGF